MRRIEPEGRDKMKFCYEISIGKIVRHSVESETDKTFKIDGKRVFKQDYHGRQVLFESFEAAKAGAITRAEDDLNRYKRIVDQKRSALETAKQLKESK